MKSILMGYFTVAAIGLPLWVMFVLFLARLCAYLERRDARKRSQNG